MNPDIVKRRLAVRIFTPEDQRRFAAWSGDVNPMHVDSVAARRLLSGRQVVHGIHTLLWALDLWQADGRALPPTLRCEFANPVSVGDEVVLEQADGGAGEPSVLTASVDGLVCTELTLGGMQPALPAFDAQGPVRPLGALDAPLDEAPEAQAGWAFAAGRDAPADAFPQAARLLGGPARLGAVMALSYTVGMVCPGLHSVFSSLRLTLADVAAPSALTFSVKRYDKRFGLFTIGFDGSLRGELRAFRRPPPQPQPSSVEIGAQVDAQAFAGAQAIVLGGSRGLGETTAKILAAGGADVLVSYAAGADDAARVAAEIEAAGRGHCRTVKLDLTADSFEALRPHAASLTEVWFFSTPRIYRKKAALFDRRAFDEFAAFYLGAFHDLCVWLEQAVGERRVQVFLPSTVFIAERPKGMTEYAMAKAAAEVLADDLNRSLDHVRVVCERLPRLATDQTASIMPVATGSSVDVLLALARALHAPGVK
jgi:NAD(P)-dependent dehydrogenase (short-subunit alcohol dehydrogenase family)